MCPACGCSNKDMDTLSTVCKDNIEVCLCTIHRSTLCYNVTCYNMGMTGHLIACHSGFMTIVVKQRICKRFFYFCSNPDVQMPNSSRWAQRLRPPTAKLLATPLGYRFKLPQSEPY